MNRVRAVAIKGFTRLQIVDKKSRKIVGDSGWLENQITNYGLESCIVPTPIKAANSLQASGMLLGSGSEPATNATVLDGSLSKWWSSFAMSSVIDSLTARMSQSFDGTDAITLANVGIFAVSSDSIIAGNTFDSSALSTDQDVNVTYELRYSTS